MTAETGTKQGTPNWADCATSDLGAAERFYAAVFGWTAEHATASDGETYSIRRLGGRMVAGIYELNQEMLRMNVTPHWATYIEVDDVDATLERVKSEGGTVVAGPFDEPEIGRIVIIKDPVGAYIRLWHSASRHGAEVFNTPGAMTWNELMTKQPAEAVEFYHKMLGVEIEAMNQPKPYTVLKVDGKPVGGILTMTPDIGDLPPSWDVYFASDDVDATTRKAITAGAKPIREPFDIPGVGRMTVLQDPQGAVFQVIKMGMS